jgi:hypothetical protein
MNGVNGRSAAASRARVAEASSARADAARWGTPDDI